jgi:hypothetical protein
MNQRELGDYSVEKTLWNLYSYIYAPFFRRHCSRSLPVVFPSSIFFPLFYGFSRGTLAKMKVV